MTIETPEFQGTHLWDRLCWAKEKLEPHRTEYCVVWEDPETPDEPAKVTHLTLIGWLVHCKVAYYHQLKFIGNSRKMKTSLTL